MQEQDNKKGTDLKVGTRMVAKPGDIQEQSKQRSNHKTYKQRLPPNKIVHQPFLQVIHIRGAQDLIHTGECEMYSETHGY